MKSNGKDSVVPSRVSAAQRIEAMLLDEISTGALEPGTRMDEAGLAARFGASRTPVREALSRLTVQGVLTPGERRGVFVTEYSTEELSQMFEAMYEIETTCARIASQRLSFLSRTEIEAAQAKCAEAAENGDREAYLKANEAFHQAIYRATANKFISGIASDFRRRTGPFRARKFRTREDLIVSARSHEGLIGDIFSQDSAQASVGMREHMKESLSKTLRVIGSPGT